MMKIGIATENNFVCEHFGHCEGFTIFEVEKDEVKNKEFISNPGHQPGFLPRYLHELGVNVIVAGGMGGGAIELFNERGIKIFTGASGKVDDIIAQLLQGNLKSSDSVCNKHEHHNECGKD